MVNTNKDSTTTNSNNRTTGDHLGVTTWKLLTSQALLVALEPGIPGQARVQDRHQDSQAMPSQRTPAPFREDLRTIATTESLSH